MSSRLTILDYVSYIKPFLNQPIDLNLVLSPLGNYSLPSIEGSILVGELVDELCSRLDLSTIVDVPIIIDIISDLETVGWIDDLWDDLKIKEKDQLICLQPITGTYF